MKLHMIVHEAFEGPGAIETWAKNNNYSISYTHLYQGDVLPEFCEFDCLIIGGGPQNPSTTLKECKHFDAKKEQALIFKAINQNKYVLGICLGAQLIGEALGAAFEKSPFKEIGVFDIKLTDDAKKDPIFSNFPQQFPVGHWHSDMPGLTDNAKILAKSEGCPRQIVRYSEKVYGFQCHFEFEKDNIEALIDNCADELIESGVFIQTEAQLRSNDYQNINLLLFTFLDYMAETLSKETKIDQHQAINV